jgi:hypothetical protein
VSAGVIEDGGGENGMEKEEGRGRREVVALLTHYSTA